MDDSASFVFAVAVVDLGTNRKFVWYFDDETDVVFVVTAVVFDGSVALVASAGATNASVADVAVTVCVVMSSTLITGVDATLEAVASVVASESRLRLTSVVGLDPDLLLNSFNVDSIVRANFSASASVWKCNP